MIGFDFIISEFRPIHPTSFHPTFLPTPLFFFSSDHFLYFLSPLIPSIWLLSSHTYVHAILQTEQNSSGAYLPIAVKSASEEIVYLQLDSRLSLELLDEVLYYTVLYFTALYCTALFCAVLHCSVLCSPVYLKT